MAQKKNNDQKTERKSSMASDSVEATIAEVEAALDSAESEEAAMEILNGEKQAKPIPETETEAEASPTGESETEQESEDEDEDFELPSTYKKDIRELVKKLPKGYEELGKSFIKRAKQIEKDRQGFYSDYQSKTAFAAKISKAVEPYLEHWQAKGIIPEIGVQRAAKLDYLIATDPNAAVKFIMQMANVRKASLDEDEIEAIVEAKHKQGLTQQPAMSQDDIRRIVQEETGRVSHIQTTTQDNLKVIEKLMTEPAANGKSKYPQFKDDAFVKSMEPLVASLLRDPTNNLSFEQACLAAYVSRGGVIEQGSPQSTQPNNNDYRKVEKLKVASTIRPANSSSNSMSLDDIDIPDSIEETIALAARLAEGRN